MNPAATANLSHRTINDVISRTDVSGLFTTIELRDFSFPAIVSPHTTIIRNHHPTFYTKTNLDTIISTLYNIDQYIRAVK